MRNKGLHLLRFTLFLYRLLQVIVAPIISFKLHGNSIIFNEF
jgi:hypothetical protein